MMGVVLDYGDDHLEFEIAADRLVAFWRGPDGNEPSDPAPAVIEALEQPIEFPPLRQMLVPGDRVAIAFDPAIPSAATVLDALMQVLGWAGVDPELCTVVVPPGSAEGRTELERSGATVEVHDPDDRARIAYLASTKAGRRIYLNRSLTDADAVVPVSLLRHDLVEDYRGPWNLLFPGLSDRATMQTLRENPVGAPNEAGRDQGASHREEAAEVGWLLGSQFAVGLVPGAIGVRAVVAGRDDAVRERGMVAIDRDWTMHAPVRAELVVAGIGGKRGVSTLDDLASALETAAGLVRRGGRIVVLSQVTGVAGPALQKLSTLDDPAEAAAALRGLEEAEDYAMARRIARAAVWADLFVASRMDPDLLEGLAITPLERPDQARRLAASSESVTLVSHAEITRAVVVDE